MKHAAWREVYEDDAQVLIEDIGHSLGHPTVTNDAEFVVSIIAPRLNGRKLRYLDSEGDESALHVKDGQFAGFAP